VFRSKSKSSTTKQSSSELTGVVRLGKKTKHLVKRLKSNEIAVIDHHDIDRVAAEGLVDAGVSAVLNCSVSTSGSYPNAGPLIVAEAGIPLVDVLEEDLFSLLKDGDTVTVEIEGAKILAAGSVVAEGELQSLEKVRSRHAELRTRVDEALERFAKNTVEHMQEEGELLAGTLKLPQLTTEFDGRPALVVVRGVDHKRDLRTLKPYIRDLNPVLVGVDGGADAILEYGFKPDMIVGDMDSASEKTLSCGAELVVHGYPDGRAPGKDILERLGLDYKIVPAPATSQDVAMLIAVERGATLIVSVGSHMNLLEFLDKGRPGMASTFLTKLRVGELLIDAKGVSRLYHPRPGMKPLALVFLVGLVVLSVVVVMTPGLRELAELLWLKIKVIFGGEL